MDPTGPARLFLSQLPRHLRRRTTTSSVRRKFRPIHSVSGHVRPNSPMEDPHCATSYPPLRTLKVYRVTGVVFANDNTKNCKHKAYAKAIGVGPKVSVWPPPSIHDGGKEGRQRGLVDTAHQKGLVVDEPLSKPVLLPKLGWKWARAVSLRHIPPRARATHMHSTWRAILSEVWLSLASRSRSRASAGSGGWHASRVGRCHRRRRARALRGPVAGEIALVWWAGPLRLRPCVGGHMCPDLPNALAQWRAPVVEGGSVSRRSRAVREPHPCNNLAEHAEASGGCESHIPAIIWPGMRRPPISVRPGMNSTTTPCIAFRRPDAAELGGSGSRPESDSASTQWRQKCR